MAPSGGTDLRGLPRGRFGNVFLAGTDFSADAEGLTDIVTSADPTFAGAAVLADIAVLPDIGGVPDIAVLPDITALLEIAVLPAIAALPDTTALLDIADLPDIVALPDIAVFARAPTLRDDARPAAIILSSDFRGLPRPRFKGVCNTFVAHCPNAIIGATALFVFVLAVRSTSPSAFVKTEVGFFDVLSDERRAVVSSAACIAFFTASGAASASPCQIRKTNTTEIRKESKRTNLSVNYV